jgi:hypothetical protein
MVIQGSVNLLAVLASTVASMIVGSIWYGPLFGKKYMNLMEMDKWTPEKQAAMKARRIWSYAGQFVASFVMFYVLRPYCLDCASVKRGLWDGYSILDVARFCCSFSIWQHIMGW